MARCGVPRALGACAEAGFEIGLKCLDLLLERLGVSPCAHAVGAGELRHVKLQFTEGVVGLRELDERNESHLVDALRLRINLLDAVVAHATDDECGEGERGEANPELGPEVEIVKPLHGGRGPIRKNANRRSP